MKPVRKLYLTIAGTLLIIIALIGLIVFPLINRIEALTQDYVNGQTLISQIRQKELLLDQEKKRFQEVQVDFLRVKNSFLKSKELVNFVASLEKIAKTNDVELETTHASSPEEGKAYFTLSASINGPFSNLMRFLFAIENTPGTYYKLAEIKSVVIKKLMIQEGEESKASPPEGKIEMKIYADN